MSELQGVRGDLVVKSIEKQRQTMYEAISENGPIVREDDEAQSDLETSVCTGWILITEWMDSRGMRWLSRVSGDAAGENLIHWTANGLLHEALYGEWPD